jgi:hypothetical protein
MVKAGDLFPRPLCYSQLSAISLKCIYKILTINNLHLFHGFIQSKPFQPIQTKSK